MPDQTHKDAALTALDQSDSLPLWARVITHALLYVGDSMRVAAGHQVDERPQALS